MTQPVKKSGAAPVGFSLISASLLIGLILAFGLALVSYILSSRSASKALEASLTGSQLAEAGIHKALFCLNATSGDNCGGTYGTLYVGEADVDLGNGTFTTTLTGGGAYRTVTSVGRTKSGQTVTIATDLTTVPDSSNITFGYALQSGEGGAYLENNSNIQGTLYSNSDVTCQSTQAKVDGDIWVAQDGGQIDSCWVKFHAHADQVLNSKVDGDAYYENEPADRAGSTITGTKYMNSPTPEVADMPDLVLQDWRDAAEDGGTYYGNYAPTDNSHLGPLKIVGNLTLNNNIDVIIDGPVWVVGNITTYNNSSFTLNSAYGENNTVILADDPDDLVNKGFIDIVNGTSINGSGNPKSHILLASTNTSMSDSSPAIRVSNTAEGAIFLAPNGVMRLASNAGAKSLAAKRLYLDQNADVIYVESELADAKFSNSPGGTWHLLEGTWHEVH